MATFNMKHQSGWVAENLTSAAFANDSSVSNLNDSRL